jgi:hypothetical protein
MGGGSINVTIITGAIQTTRLSDVVMGIPAEIKTIGLVVPIILAKIRYTRKVIRCGYGYPGGDTDEIVSDVVIGIPAEVHVLLSQQRYR